MFCKNCGSQLSDDSTFCPNCGYKSEETVLNKNTESTKPNYGQTEGTGRATNTSSDNHSKELHKKPTDKIFLGGFALAAFGTILFLGMVFVSLIEWGEVSLYDGSDFTAVLTTISLCLMLLGLLVLSCMLMFNLKTKSIMLLTNKSFVFFSTILIILCIGLSVWGFTEYANEKDSGSSYGDSSYGGSYGGYYNSGIDKRIGLSLKVDRIETSGSYTYVYCTVTNVSSRYVATQYRYVKVKAQFKDYSGSIIDTDWTYAIDSTWLEPGESKTFYYMVRNTKIKSATLSFVD